MMLLLFYDKYSHFSLTLTAAGPIQNENNARCRCTNFDKNDSGSQQSNFPPKQRALMPTVHAT